MEPVAAVRTVSVDYSDDELDAIADAFSRPDLARRTAPEGDHDPVRRAVLQAALRALVARRAIRLSGTRARPRIVFLEPHATLLGAFVSADAVATVRVERSGLLRAVSFFARGEAVVEQHGLPDIAVQRMVAHPRPTAPALLGEELGIPPTPASGAGGPITATRRQIGSAIEAVSRGEDVPERLPARLHDVIFARTGSTSVTVTRGSTEDGTREVSRWAWIDAGEEGLWLVRGSAEDPIVSLEPVDGAALRTEIETSWVNALG